MPTADIVSWPLNTLYPTEISLELMWNTRGGGAGLNGIEQIVSPLSALWSMSITLNVGTEEWLRGYRALKAEMKGRFGWIRFPLFDPHRVRRADAGWDDSAPIPFSDGTFFSDGSGFASPDITTTVAVAGEIGDEEVAFVVDPTLNDALGTGHYLSINDYLHLVVRPLEKAGDNRIYKIAPPLRADIASADEVKIGRPTMLCRLADDKSGSVSLKYGRFGEPHLDFVEVLAR